MGVFQQQLFHVYNRCISDDPDWLPYVRVSTINDYSTSHHLPHYQSLRGTSKVEVVHSVLNCTFYPQCGIGAEVFDALLGWWIFGYNRCHLCALGKKVLPDSMPPKVFVYFPDICADVPEDMNISTEGETGTSILCIFPLL